MDPIELFKTNAGDYGEKKNVVLGITGSIAAYKSVEIARLLTSWGYFVRCIMSDSAQQFITPMTLAAVTGNPVITDFWTEEEVTGIGHIKIADWADVFLVAPATADCIAKMANGFADSPLLAAILATKAKLIIAPAMNVNMLEHPTTQKNIEQLKSQGAIIVDPEVGALACGWTGSGRLANPMEIFYEVRKSLSQPDYSGKHVLITTGPTREHIDPVRFLTNRSSGKMGIALAREAFRRGATVTLLHGPVSVRVPSGVRCLPFSSTKDLEELIQKEVFAVPADRELKAPDVVIMSAAVSDARPVTRHDQKVKKDNLPKTLELALNNDVLAELGKKRGDQQRPVLVGFAVETGDLEDLLSESRRKLESKAIDLIIGNFAQEAFDLDTNRIWLVDKVGRQEEVATTYKSRVANRILDAVLRL
jgi:phosphopantothenoylcysteine decarboxylase/phosphopantothenate--cysteine ligase